MLVWAVAMPVEVAKRATDRTVRLKRVKAFTGLEAPGIEDDASIGAKMGYFAAPPQGADGNAAITLARAPLSVVNCCIFHRCAQRPWLCWHALRACDITCPCKPTAHKRAKKH